MCNSTDTCLTLGNYLSSLHPETSEGRGFLESKLNSYFFWKAHMGKMQNSLKRTPGFNKGERRSSSTNAAAGASGTGNTGGAFASSSGASKFPGSKDGDGEMSAALKRKDFKRGQAPPTKRRRVRGGGAAGSTAGTARGGGKNGETAPMFAAATGANPEALEEEVKKIAELCVSPAEMRVRKLKGSHHQRRLVCNAWRRHVGRGH
jgi:DNA excision repair protein ERCC-4